MTVVIDGQYLAVTGFDRKAEYVNNSSTVKVTKNGEISWDCKTKEFVVYDETYSSEVARTNYPLVALAALGVYCKEYLEGDPHG